MQDSDDMRRELPPSGLAGRSSSGTAGLAGPVLPDFARTLLDSMTEGVSLATEDGTIVYTNPAEDRMFGYPPGELVGQHVSVQNAYSPEENARVVGEVIGELKRSGHWRGEWQNRRKDGSAFTTVSRISAVELEGRSYWLCVQEDVTEDRAATAALQESRARLELATAAAELGIWDWDVATGRLDYSARAKAICGLQPDVEVTFQLAQRLTHPEDLPRTSAMARRALDPAIREHAPYQYRIVRPDGVVRWVLAHGEAVFQDGAPRAVRYVGTLQDITERLRLEEADRSSKARLALAIEAGRMAVWELEFATDEIQGSPELNRLLGFPDDAKPTAEDMRSRYYPGERERLRALGQAALARGDRSLDAEYRYVWPDGSVRWLWLRAEVVLDSEGRPVRAVGVVMDVTERRRSEEALRTSEARLKLAQRAAGIGVWDWDLDSGGISWSPEMFGILGLDPAVEPTASLEAWLRVLHPDDRDSAQAATQRAAAEGDSFTVDSRIAHGPSGEQRWVRSHGVAVLDAEGRPSRVVGVSMDVTDERRREQELRALAGNLRSAVEAGEKERDRIYELSNDLFAVAGFDGYLKTINPAWERMLGYSRETLLANPFATVIHPDDHAAAAEVLAAMQTGQALQRFEDRLVRVDGSVVWIAWAAVPEGERFYAVGRDVTRDKEREEALRQAQKMEAVGQLTGGIAHDFNNLLQGVAGSLDLIRRRPDDAERVRRWAEAGLQAAERGTKLTGQLLAFSRAQKLELKPLDVANLVAGLEDLLTRTVGPLVRVTLEVDAERAPVLCDPTQLEMAVLNLAINARDAMESGGQLTITTRICQVGRDPDLEPGDYVEIGVHDTGTGMPPEVVARAFDPFFTTKGVGKGTGLGLSQVYGMARQAGGTARIDTAPGAGTTVRLLLPRTDLPVLAPSERKPTAGVNAGPAASVLVVDDDPDVRRFLADSLDALGYAVLEAEDGRVGLRLLESTAPDLLVIDFAMPGLNGAEVAREARLRRPDLPIVFASGYAETHAIEAAVGPNALILRKPFRVDELQAVLSQALRGKAAAANTRPVQD